MVHLVLQVHEVQLVTKVTKDLKVTTAHKVLLALQANKVREVIADNLVFLVLVGRDHQAVVVDLVEEVTRVRRVLKVMLLI